jgi:hypothetical protein
VGRYSFGLGQKSVVDQLLDQLLNGTLAQLVKRTVKQG